MTDRVTDVTFGSRDGELFCECVLCGSLGAGLGSNVSMEDLNFFRRLRSSSALWPPCASSFGVAAVEATVVALVAEVVEAMARGVPPPPLLPPLGTTGDGCVWFPVDFSLR